MKKYVIILRRKDEYPMFKYIRIETVCSNFQEALEEGQKKINGLMFGQKIVYEIDSINREW